MEFAAGLIVAGIVTIILLNWRGGASRVQQRVQHRIDVRDPEFLHEMGVLLGPPLAGGNRVEHFENGDEIFPAMLAAIRGARRSVTFETYIYWSGDVGKAFAEALAERASAGVPVHVMLDWVGSQRMDASLLDLMAEAGVEIERFHPPHWYTLARMNNRTHRKLLVVDGTVGFTGGVGIADVWLGHAQDPAHWRDSHYRATGPVVAQMQAAFLDNWIEVTGQVLTGPAYLPRISPCDPGIAAQLFKSGPTGGADSMQLMYLLAIAGARESIDLAAAYFLPDALTRAVLVDARGRGIRVRIIVPGRHIDARVVRHASRSDWGALLEAGIEMHEFEPTRFHCKLLIVDRFLTSVGSTNFDNRSFRLNDEANLNVYDADFGAEVTRVFEADLKRSRRITLEDWRRRPWHRRAVERAAALMQDQL
ncbi:MAG TPA: phospholipase D-like domain-containing protein [Steroidobacteraceae bacterium]|nr:phospholipase D-like domain-containing protein [Steroidobacteraceae bacterium]